MDRAREATLFPEYDICYGKPMVLGSSNTPPKSSRTHPKSVKRVRVLQPGGVHIQIWLYGGLLLSFARCSERVETALSSHLKP
eukprot:scaffold76089_cov57-Phaeocystis_antarctica.AAC.2